MRKNRKPTKSNLKALDQLQDKDIDYSDIPELDDKFFKEAARVTPEHKLSLTVRYDKEVIDYFKQVVGRGYQSKMNAILKAYVRHAKKLSTRR